MSAMAHRHVHVQLRSRLLPWSCKHVFVPVYWCQCKVVACSHKNVDYLGPTSMSGSQGTGANVKNYMFLGKCWLPEFSPNLYGLKTRI